MKHYDLILLHPPSIYDFRKRGDVLFTELQTTLIDSSPIYEIPPLGLWNLCSFLQNQDFRVHIVNLAKQMLDDNAFDVERFLKNLTPRALGISFHWMIHVQGALSIADRFKQYHRDIPVLFGGISASYFYRELIQYSFVDFIIRGNITYQPLASLLSKFKHEVQEFSDIPNLCYKSNGQVFVNRVRFYGGNNIHAINWNEKSSKNQWIDHWVLNPQSGCDKHCRFCGGGATGTQIYGLQQHNLVYRTPLSIWDELQSIQKRKFHNTPKPKPTLTIFNHWHSQPTILKSMLENLEQVNNFSNIFIYAHDLIRTPIIQEIVKICKPVFILSPHSHNISIRQMCAVPNYTNTEMEAWIDGLLEKGVRLVEICFMIGLPKQTEYSVMKDLEYCEYLLEKYKSYHAVLPMISPMYPYLDIGSEIYENPKEYGYRIFYHTLSDYYHSSTALRLDHHLNYETENLSRSQIVNISFRSMIEMLQIKGRQGYLPRSLFEIRLNQLVKSQELFNQLNRIDAISSPATKKEEIKNISKTIQDHNHNVLQSKWCYQCLADLSLFQKKFWYETIY